MVATDATGLRRGLTILLAVAEQEGVGEQAPGVTRIATLIGREKSQVSRALKILAEAGFVDRDPETLGYRLGWRLLAMAGRSTHAALTAAAESQLTRLVRALGERAHLSVLRGQEVLTVLSEAPDRTIQTVGWVGRTVPAYSSSSGRALLFDHERAGLDEFFRGVTFAAATPRTPRDVEELYARIAAARDRGFALVDEEFEPGLVGAAAPVRDFRGRVVAALNVSAPKFRFAQELERAGQLVKNAADDISAEIGWQGSSEVGGTRLATVSRS